MRWKSSINVTFACAALLLLGALPARASLREFYADLDHDGVSDVVSIPEGARGLLVWLSRSHSVLRLRTRLPIFRVAAADVDGDGRMDLVAADMSAGLHVWRRSSRGHLRRMHPRSRPYAAGPASGHGIEESSENPPPAVDAGTAGDAPFDAPHPAQTFLVALNLAPRPPTSAIATPCALAQLQPRAPPLSSTFFFL